MLRYMRAQKLGRDRYNLIDPDMCYCHEFDMEVAKDDDPCVYYEEAQRGTTNERPERET